ncbi:MAG: T9SS type B sorting domain-containing protein [Chitinophagaceae bacterium]|nr:T9SS type B sorting domain-containing protein [Chitinophagaceae bacterium]
MISKSSFVVFLIVFSFAGKAQTCLAPPQTPASAILVCGSAILTQGTPTLCGQTDVPGSCTGNQNINPTYFRVACFGSGTLGFIITPDDLTANYNWQLFDITNRNPFDIFSDPSLFVACNWSPEPGETGASIDGINISECSNSALPFSSMPSVLQGRTYLLMVSNKSGSAGNYQLNFTGGSASITDPVLPQLLVTTVNCDATKISLQLNKSIRCGSIAADGSDFMLSAGANITGAAPGVCNPQGLTDLVTLSLDQSLPAGNYMLMIKNGTDGNTLIDLCDFSVAAGDNINVVSGTPQPTLLDSIRPAGCKPSFIEMIFKRPIRCNSIAPDGSDFVLTGPQAVITTVSLNNCINSALVNVIRLNLSSPLTTGGIYTVQLQNGTDGNTLIDECGLLSPAGSSASFTVSSSVSAAFTYSRRSSCTNDTLDFLHDGNNGANSWNWKFDNAVPVTTQNFMQLINDTEPHTVRLIVSNGNCSDTSTQTIKMPVKLKAAFKAPAGVCPGDMVTLISNSSGNITHWVWDLGNSMISNLPNPAPYQYPISNRTISYQVKLTVVDMFSGCTDTIKHTIIAVDECQVLVPTAFTPNDDGLNDYLGLLNASKVDNPEFKVYDRFGQLVFASTTITAKWDGRLNGIRLNSGIFVWMLSYTNRDTGKRIFQKGTTMLVR